MGQGPVQNYYPDLNEIQRQHKGRLVRRFISGILVGTLLTCFVGFGVYLFSGLKFLPHLMGANGPDLSELAGTDLTDELMTDETITKLNALEDVIDEYYYKPDVDKDEEAAGMYKGLLSSLGDPYSVYYTDEELQDLMQDSQGIYYGIGAYVSIDQELKAPMISGVMPGTPAEEAGLVMGDILYMVDDVSTEGMSLEEVVGMIKGDEGTTVHITILRGDKREQLEIDVVRAQVEVPTVSTKMLDDNIGYLQITEFDDVTPDQFAEGMAELRENNMQGLVLDLRSNPGGSVAAVCDIANMLLPKGIIVYTMDKDGNREDYECDGKHEIDIPLVVLVNQYSASASEILSGAIKDYGIGQLVGMKTYGKGIIQRIFDLKDGTAVKLTVSNYYTPNGNSIHGIGIEPDVEIEFDSDAYMKDKSDNQLDKAVEVMEGLLDN